MMSRINSRPLGMELCGSGFSRDMTELAGVAAEAAPGITAYDCICEETER